MYRVSPLATIFVFFFLRNQMQTLSADLHDSSKVLNFYRFSFNFDTNSSLIFFLVHVPKVAEKKNMLLRIR